MSSRGKKIRHKNGVPAADKPHLLDKHFFMVRPDSTKWLAPAPE
jgi:hypothetical protein